LRGERTHVYERQMPASFHPFTQEIKKTGELLLVEIAVVGKIEI
jgi:hypothetical protein